MAWAAARSCRPRPTGSSLASSEAGRVERGRPGADDCDASARSFVIGRSMLRPTRATTRRATMPRDVEAPPRPDRGRRGGRRPRRASSPSSAKAWCDSRLPDTYSVMSYGTHEYGGGRGAAEPRGTRRRRDRASPTCTGRPRASPTRTSSSLRRAPTIRLSSGRVVHALTFDGDLARPGASRPAGRPGRGRARNEDVEQGVTIHWHGVDVPNAEDGVAGVTQNAVLPGETLHVPLPRRPGRDVLVPHAPGLVGGGPARPLRRGRDRAARQASRASSTASRRAHVRRDRDAQRRRETPSAGKVPAGTQVRLRLVNTDSFDADGSPSSGTPFRVLAIDGRRPERAGRPRPRRAPARRRRAGTTSASCMPSGGVRDRASRAPRLASSSSPSGGPALRARRRRRADFDPLDVRHAGADAVRCQLEPFDRRFELKITQEARLLRRHARVAVGDQRRHLPGRAGVRRREGRPRRDHDHERHERRPPDAPARSSPARAEPQRTAVDGQPVVVGHAERRLRARATWSLSARTTRDLDGPLPQPRPRRRRADDARRLRRRQHAVPRRRRARATAPE